MIGHLAENMQARTTSRGRDQPAKTMGREQSRDYVPPDVVEAAFARSNKTLETACKEAALSRLVTKRIAGRGRR